MPTPVPDKNSTHLAGEYFVAAELYRRGYSVAMTLGNAKAIDLFAEFDGLTVNVQVKAIRDKKSIGWPMMTAKIMDNVIYIFVCLNGAAAPPDFYLCTAAEVRKAIKQYSTRGIVDLSVIKKGAFLSAWSKVEEALLPVAEARTGKRKAPVT
jgi:hypothetical protein